MKLAGLDVRAFVLTVLEMPDKTRQIQDHFQEVGVEAENFSGFNALTSGLTTSHTYDEDNPGQGYTIGPKGVAVWVSQYMLLSALNILPEPYFLTLEWDAKFEPNWKERTEQAIRDTPKDFDILMLGSCCAEGKENNARIAGEVWRVKYPMCNQAMLIAKKALPRILQTQRIIYAPWDISLKNHTYPDLLILTVLLRIVEQFNTCLQP